MRWAAVALLLMLAGCAQTGDGAAPPSLATPLPTPAPGPDADVPFVAHRAMLLAFDYTGCDGQATRLELDPATAQAALPDGYVAWTQGRLHEGGPAAAWVEYLWVLCAAFAAPQVTLNDTVYGHVAVRVATPDNGTAADEHWYRLRMLTGPGVLEAVWEAAGYDVFADDFSSSTAVMRTVALGAYSLEAVAAVAGPAVEREVAYYTDVEAGRLEWTGRIAGDSIEAVGRLEVPADDPLAGHAGPAVQAAFVSGDFAGNDLWLRRDAPA